MSAVPTGNVDAFWSQPAEAILNAVGSSPQGLSSAEAADRLRRDGPNTLRARKRVTRWGVFLSQFKSPIVILLIAAAFLSWGVGDRTDALIILGIVLASAVLSFYQEYGAGNAVEKLLALVRTTVEVLRDGKTQSLPLEAIVPGDVVLLDAGSLIPGDGLLLESQNLFVDEAALTGETFPDEKQPGVLPEETDLARRSNSLFSGTHVVSGAGKMVVIKTGRQTEFGHIAERLQLRPPETSFEQGVRHFGYLLIEFTFVLTFFVFAANVFLKKPPLDSFLFALALAVGLTPQLLPAIISVNLARGAREMARAKVIVKRLAAIENFGSMSVLCSDKTGTLTEGVVHVHGAFGPDAKENPEVLRLAQINAALQTGFRNPIDEALAKGSPPDLTQRVKRLAELPYDFVRRRLSVLVQDGEKTLLVTKGALEQVLAVCHRVSGSGSDAPEEALDSVREGIMAEFAEYSQKGLRVLGVAVRSMAPAASLTADDEADMCFVGFLVLDDPLREDAVQTVSRLRSLGVSLKMITGDNRLVAAYIGQQVGLSAANVLTGEGFRQLSDSALMRLVTEVDIFAEVQPNQKERLILALRKAGFVVGYVGDGINDGAALHTADVGISVANAVDVAKEAADLVMLESNLAVLVGGVQEGRKTFANTLKYVFMASSANFGNMFSMAGASLLFPFLPLLAKQILVLNLLTDMPEMTIATDAVDREQVEKPQRWNVHFLRRFMLLFGSLSSIFDYMAFEVLHAMGAARHMLGTERFVHIFRTGWFVESLVSATLIVLVLRSRRPFFRSSPSRLLVFATVGVIIATLALPYTPIAAPLGFTRLPGEFLAAMIGVVALYVLSAEIMKRWFYRRERM